MAATPASGWPLLTAVIPRRVSYSLVEHGNVEVGCIVVKRLKIDISGERSRGSDGIQQREDDDVCTPDDGTMARTPA